MSCLKLLSLQFWFLWLVLPLSATANLARFGCNDTCGSITIPFPFGIGSNCPLNDWYAIDCKQISNSSKPYLQKLNVEVLGVSLTTQIVTINTPVAQFCHPGLESRGIITWNSSDLSGSPFFFSKAHNKLMVLGCGKAFLSQNKVLSGCSSTCEFDIPEVNGCYGSSCCEISIPFYLRKYHLNFTSLRFNTSWNCSSAFLVEQSWFPERISDPFVGRSLESVPVALTWTVQKSDLDTNSSCIPGSSELQLESGKVIKNWNCTYRGSADSNSSISAYHNPGDNRGDFCPTSSVNVPIIIGFSTGIAVLFVGTINVISYKLLRKRRNRKIKSKIFKRNGGLLLQKELSAVDNVIENTKIFTVRELEKATDKFNENRILGRGGQGTVYKGMLSDGRIVAIKKSKLVDKGQLEQFINEVVLLSKVVHKNVVRLLGCCLETEVPLLVYEFIPNGTLYDLMHNEIDGSITWNTRLRIATEVAGALAYLHSALSVPIYHRDIKSSNILLDEKYVAKVSDFGTSMFVPVSKTHITTLVKGTFGYLDPEYFWSGQFTEKSDVYSFGVVLVELLTRQKAVSSIETGDEDSNASLVGRFLEAMENNCLKTILDAQVLDHNIEEEVTAIAKLAQQCLKTIGKNRPSMKEAHIDLENIRISASHQAIQRSCLSLECIDDESLLSNSSPPWIERSTSARLTSNPDPVLFDTI